jgi:hypothetical protein
MFFAERLTFWLVAFLYKLPDSLNASNKSLKVASIILLFRELSKDLSSFIFILIVPSIPVTANLLPICQKTDG